MKLWQKIKNLLKRFLPPPTRAFIRESQAIQTEIKKEASLIRNLALQLNGTDQQLAEMRQEFNSTGQQLAEMRQEFNSTGQQLAEMRQEFNGTGQQLAEMRQELDVLQRELDAARAENKALQTKLASGGKEVLCMLRNDIKPLGVKAARNSSEAVWAAVFNNTITNSTWLLDKTFSPGRWAVGYQMLYVMYRVLDEMRPKNILELGLGQSTRMIAQYAAGFGDVRHTVVEHDEAWISFFRNSFDLPDNTSIVQLERELVPYKEAEAVRVFKGFADAFGHQKFDFIMIDAPLGGDMKQYARIDLLSIIPEALAESFVIVLDDAHRSGESRTAKEIEAILIENGIEYARGNYSGQKDCTVICDAKNKFVTTM